MYATRIQLKVDGSSASWRSEPGLGTPSRFLALAGEAVKHLHHMQFDQAAQWDMKWQLFRV